MRGRLRSWEWATIAAITLAAAALRLIQLGRVPTDPFYDAAVRSMSLSFHNFFFGAYEPSGTVSIDKPPVNLWLQVASVKLLGFSRTTLKLPEALAGTAAVPLLFAVVRRVWSPAAALAAAASLAALPVEVITARSDTMDGVMMVLLVLAALFAVLAAERGSTIWLVAAAAAGGVAFDVKLLESLVALPGLAVFVLMAMPGRTRRRALQLALAAAVYVAVALSWLTATLLVPESERPYAIGSTNGSAWNAAFVFNGTDRLGGKSPEPQQGTSYQAGHRYPEATQSERDHIPIVPPSPPACSRRSARCQGSGSGWRLLIGLLLGLPALISDLTGWGSRSEEARLPATIRAGPQPIPVGAGTGGPRLGGAGVRTSSPPAPVSTQAVMPEAPAATRATAPRIRRAGAAGLIVWVLCGIALFSDMVRLHPRYVEGLAPAAAALLGVGLAWAARPSGRLRLALLAGALVVNVYYAERLLYGRPAVWWVALAGAAGAIALAFAARIPGGTSPVRRLLRSNGGHGAGARGGPRHTDEGRRDGDRRPGQRRRPRRSAAGEQQRHLSDYECGPTRGRTRYEWRPSRPRPSARLSSRTPGRCSCSRRTTPGCSRRSPSSSA